MSFWSPHCSFGLYLRTAASFPAKDKWKDRALIWSGGRGSSGVLGVLLISEVINSSLKNRRPKCEMMQLLWETVWWFLTKLKVELLYHPAVPLLGLYLKELKMEYWRDTCIYVHSIIIHNNQDVEASHQWMDKGYVVYTCNEIAFSPEKEGYSDTWYNMDESWDQISQSQKRQILHNLTYMRYLK